MFGVDVGTGGDGAGLLSRQRIWVLYGGGQLMLRCGPIFLEDGYAHRAAGSVIGLVMVVR